MTSTAPHSIVYADHLMDFLPNTFFIIIKRNDRDVSAEIYTTEYRKENFHSYDPIQLKKYLFDYYEMCKILKSKVADRAIEISYEELVKEPEKTLERIGVLVSQKLNVTNIRHQVKNHGFEGLFSDHYARFLENQ